jgi:hypothetical protein
VCYVTTSADPFNLLNGVSDIKFVAPVLCYNFELCTSTLIAQAPKEGHDKFSNKLKSILDFLNLLLLLLLIFCHKIFIHTEDILQN